MQLQNKNFISFKFTILVLTFAIFICKLCINEIKIIIFIPQYKGGVIMFKKTKISKNNLNLFIKNLQDKNILFTNNRYEKLQDYKTQFQATENQKSKQLLQVIINKENTNFILYKLEVANFLNKYENDNKIKTITKKLINTKNITSDGDFLVPIPDKDKSLFAIANKLYHKSNDIYLKKHNKEVNTNESEVSNNNLNNEYVSQPINEKLRLYKRAELIYNLVKISLNPQHLNNENVITTLNLYYKKVNELQNNKNFKQFKHMTIVQQFPFIQDILIGSAVVYKNTKQLQKINNCISNYITFFNEKNGYKDNSQELTK